MLKEPKASFKTVCELAVMQQGYPVVFTQPPKVTDAWLHGVTLSPLHMFFQLFYGGISPSRCQQEVLHFL